MLFMLGENNNMDLDLREKQVLITGGTRGIGLASAKAFAKEGCVVHITGRKQQDLEHARKSIGTDYQIHTHICDLKKNGATEKLAKDCREVDILVNNAGATPTGPIELVGVDEWREGLELKVIATVDLTKKFYEFMCKRKKGVIINVIGNCGERPDPEIIVATVTNSGMMNFTRALGSVSVNHGVRVLGVNPGATSTERLVHIMEEKARDRYGDPKLWERLVEPLPFRRASTPIEQADMIVFAASDRCSYVSGTILTVDAGIAQRGHIF